MDYLYYQRKINDVIVKCPIEAGIEILVYNLLDQIVNMERYSVVDINRVQKNKDSRLSTMTGVPDIAILSPDFEFKKEDHGIVYGFVEVKAAGISLRVTRQILGQMSKVPHYIFTNGIVWQYYYNQKLEWKKSFKTDRISYSNAKITIEQNKFEELKQALQNISWKE